MQNICNLRPQLIARFAETIDDFAEMSFVNPEHLRHSVLTEPTGINSQLQIRVDVALNWHFVMTQCLFGMGNRA